MGSKLQEWAKAVKDRDGKCVECESRHDLHAHHIKPRATHPELTLDVTNGKTLCYRCHKAAHEAKRVPRVRSNKPQRRTLQRIINGLEEQVRNLKAENTKLRHLARVCARGACASGLELSRRRHQ